MPYKNRLKEFSTDTHYHVYARGQNKKDIFIDQADYKFFLYLLKKYLTPNFVEKRLVNGVLIESSVNSVSDVVALNAFCLLPNHFHLIVYNKEVFGMSSLFRRVLSVYSNYFNQKYDTQGSLIQGNYRAVPIGTTGYLVNAFLYVHLNPVKHGLCKMAVDYDLSSLKYYLSPKSSPKWLKINPDILAEVDFTKIDSYLLESSNWEEHL